MEYAVLYIAIFVCLVIVAIIGKIQEGKQKQYILKIFKENYGKKTTKKWKEEEYDAISAYFHRTEQENKIDDITWNDLGMDEVFRAIDFTGCAAGEEILYNMLRTPCLNEAVLQEREELFRVMEQEKLRVPLMYELRKIGRSGKYSIFDYIDLLDNLGKRSNTPKLIANVLFFLSFGLCFKYPAIGISGLIGIGVYNFITYFKEKGEVDPYIVSFSYVMRMLYFGDKILQVLKKEDGNGVLWQKIKILEEELKVFRPFKKHSYLIMSPKRMQGNGDPLEMVLDYLRMLFHLDLIKFNQMLEFVRTHEDSLTRLLVTVGELDAAVSVAYFRASLQGDYCIPVFTTEKQLSMQEGYHPLLNEPVKNSIQAGENILITGSNASGKSTFLKTVAINAILAQSIHTCLAREFVTAFYSIYSSMALRDDLLSGESYYIVEIKALKRILDASAGKEHPVLCFVDEVLRGTNTVERIAASVQILKELGRRNVLCFTATHDIELTRLLKEQFVNYHFSELFEEGTICFDYLLKEGEATSRNAIKLLELIGFDKGITKTAEQMAESFLVNGTWS